MFLLILVLRSQVNEDDIYISCIEMNDVKQGILELIHESKIKKLVMGAASDRDYSEYVLEIYYILNL